MWKSCDTISVIITAEENKCDILGTIKKDFQIPEFSYVINGKKENIILSVIDQKEKNLTHKLQ